MTFYSTKDSIVLIAIAQTTESKVNVKDTVRNSIECGVLKVFKQIKKPNFFCYLKLGF
ncbi:hypothetical protein [Okeania sp. SIO1I7]|uniref:hypothetical protein n=1 Tax=Okeania sp. SIO1I7 TaxID=2607772 RepID=UPI0025CE2168|nr:hypothetical protein [Okeania sp. SIO1I7]